MLERNLREAHRALAGQKLSPALVERPLAERRERLAALQRVMRSLDPDTVLARGYVRVTGPDGTTLTDRAAAAAQPSLTLKFRDGDLQVAPGETPPPSPPPQPSRAAPRRRVRDSGTAPAQDDLFG